VTPKGKVMRLDKYLKVSRLIKRRTVANEACDAGKIYVNDKAAGASYSVKPGDVIEIRISKGLEPKQESPPQKERESDTAPQQRKPLKVRVLKITEMVGKENAALMYEVCN
jgi:ribosomal 50S subunit-recycling heat shock protein